MTLLKKYAWYGSAVVASLALAVAMLLTTSATTAKAAAPTIVNVIIDEGLTAVGAAAGNDNDSIQSNSNAATAVQIVFYVDDGGVAPADSITDETIVTLTTTVGTFSNGSTTIQVQCANDGLNTGLVTVDDDDTAANSATPVGISEGAFSGTGEGGAAVAANEDAAATTEGCLGVAETLIVPAGVAQGTYQITATTTNGIADVENLVVTAPTGVTASAIANVGTTGLSHNAIGYDSSTYDPWVPGTLYTVRVTDASGAGVNGAQVQFTTDMGVLAAADAGNCGAAVAPDTISSCSETEVYTACQSALVTGYGTSLIATTGVSGTTSTNQGRGAVILCGNSTAAGKTATVTATVVGKTFTANGKATVSAEPAPGAVTFTVTTTGGVVNVTAMVGDVPAPDDTALTFQPIPADNAVVSAGCVNLLDGKGSSAYAISATNASVLITLVDRNDADANGDNCNDATQETWASTSATLTGSVVAPPPPGGGTGAGTFASTPVYSSGTVKLAQVVFNGGTIAQLDAALVAANASGAWAQTSTGAFVLYIVGAPSFANAPYTTAFPTGHAGVTALTLVGK